MPKFIVSISVDAKSEDEARQVVSRAMWADFDTHEASNLPGSSTIITSESTIQCELLEALKAALPLLPGHLDNDTAGRPILTQVRAAIAKAEGRV